MKAKEDLILLGVAGFSFFVGIILGIVLVVGGRNTKVLPPDTGLVRAVADAHPGWWTRSEHLSVSNETDWFWLRRVWTNDNIYEVWRMQQ